MIGFIGAGVHVAAGDPENRFLPSPEAFSSIEADALILASPSPVTGVAIPAADLAMIVGNAVERGVSVILDRTYATCLYEPEAQPFQERALTEQLFLIGSFSVSHALRGWQVGYFVSPEQHIAELRGLKQAMSICTTAISQFAALAALEQPTDWFDGRRRELRARRDSVIARLQAAGLPVLAPDAYPPLMIDTRQINSDARSVVEHLRGSGVAVEPGSRFGLMTAGFIRIDLSCDAEALDEGVRRIVALGNDGNRHG
jgi:aspartate/methionine/tyrosine aminotransferase